MSLSPRVPDLPSLELLVSVARLGSIGAAAAEHGISQPSASNRIRTMERLVGVTLLERSPRGSQLTESGQLLVEWAGAVVDAARVLDGGIDALRRRRESRLRVSASLTIAEYLLPGWLARLRTERPETSVALTVANSTEVARALIEGEADLGFVEGPYVQNGLQSVTVADDELVLVVAPGHRWARRGAPVAAPELRDTPLICREQGSGTRAAVAEALREYGTQVAPLLELASTTAVKASVAAGAGAAVTSSLSVVEELTSGRLVSVPVSGADFHRRLRAVWPRGRRPSGPAADLLRVAQAVQAARRAASP
ncbi:LysR family transcriptional regulator [Stackebrandtia nassauensis]|uniref:Transcriptional regulator, LysR family n=1 Tax=Stackebrandtia nassauensis (strain DSM 44728 / CIP 108903 / NRRL B-16338 / NBRC 102104 / LLR-40K-21) TaxID=446470 RepID=D3QAZ3_STANL|nr:LysR family transcriptional regulator [Stackebrandtia nassauensis]ADD44789.1 transcriptional regulator, LysR family [Stackebrandtia nassauensis DSM 44728]